MNNAVATTTVEMLMAAMSCHAGDDGFPTSFLYGPPDAWHKGLGTVVYFSESKIIRAALYIRKHGPPYLKYLAVGDIRKLLTNFVVENYWHLSDETFFKRFDGAYSDFVSLGMKAKLTALFEASSILKPVSWPTLYPLVIVQVDADFAAESFFLCSPDTLLDQIGASKASRMLRPDRFPLSKDWKGKSEAPSAWLGVRSPALQSSRKMKAAILGAMALTPIRRERYSFSMRPMFGGRSTIDDGLTTSFGGPHTPPLSADIAIGKVDHSWLAVVADKLRSSDKEARRHIKALEYFYRAWPLEAAERFPLLCMTLDGLFGDASESTQSVINGIRSAVGPHVCEKRLSLLMKLRGSVIHGGAPDVYDSRKYALYYEKFGQNPTTELELVAAECLRKVVFGDALVEHPDPHGALIAEQQTMGRLPRGAVAKTILHL